MKKRILAVVGGVGIIATVLYLIVCYLLNEIQKLDDLLARYEEDHMC